MKFAALIPARGGSKRIPRKNLATIAGRSLVAIAIDTARAAEVPAYVSTDDDEIRHEAACAGAAIIMRPPELATDTSSTEAAVRHALSAIVESDLPDAIVLIQATSPCVPASKIREACELLEHGGYDSVYAVTRAPGLAFLGELCTHENGDLTLALGRNIATRPRTQDCSPIAHECGAFYVFTRAHFERTRNRMAYAARSAVVVLDADEAIDIDEPADLERARRVFAMRTWRSDGVDCGHGPERTAIGCCDPWGVGNGNMAAPIDTSAHEAAAQARRAKLAAIEVLCLDFDGVLTDGTVDMDLDGNETARVSRRDGHGIAMLREAGIEVFIVTREPAGPARRRAEKLGIEHVSTRHKGGWVSGRFEDRLDRVAFMGDDLPDLEALSIVGVPCCPRDAQKEVVFAVEDAGGIVVWEAGGDHAVRALADEILAARKAAA